MSTAVAALSRKIDVLRCMGDWYVQVAIPTAFDQNAHNGLEQYTWDEKKQRVKVRYTYNDKSPDGPVKEVLQIGRCNPSDENGTRWQVAPWVGISYLPFWLGYNIIGVDDDYTYLVASSPSTTGSFAWLYIMTREKVVTDEYLAPLIDLSSKAGWDMSKSQRVPQLPPGQLS
eukprot:FR743730.1.p1 GENE.FR743730.1~~FR743730.1.p1  ORF type:complete len:172 (+),score=23.54 FR743730.1:57-572(+)